MDKTYHFSAPGRTEIGGNHTDHQDVYKRQLESYEKQTERHSFPECLNLLRDYTVENSFINDTIAERDLFDTKIMGCLTPRPSEVVRKFWSLYAESPKDVYKRQGQR